MKNFSAAGLRPAAVLLWDGGLVRQDLFVRQDDPSRHPDHQRHTDVDGDRLIVRSAGFAVVGHATARTFNVGKQFGAEDTAPPGKADGLGLRTAAFGTRFVCRHG
jgi:hypothetical protein